MEFTKEEVARRMDHAVLKPFATDEDVVRNAEMCVARGVGSLCVRPADVRLAAKRLADSACTVSMVVGFPHGSNVTEIKVAEARRGIDDGAAELDMVMNIGKFFSGEFTFVGDDIAAVLDTSKAAGALVKVILETSILTPDQVRKACRVARSAGADFVKTSTGFAGGGATPEVVGIMLETVGDAMGVKASGGVRTWEVAVGYLKQGCKRLGVASAEAILDGCDVKG